MTVSYDEALDYELGKVREYREPKEIYVGYNREEVRGRRTVLVGVVCERLCYGGSEEGGWWYDEGRLETKLVRVRACRALDYARGLAKKMRPFNATRDYHSVLGGWQLVVMVGTNMSDFNYPTRRPRYE